MIVTLVGPSVSVRRKRTSSATIGRSHVIGPTTRGCRKAGGFGASPSGGGGGVGRFFIVRKSVTSLEVKVAAARSPESMPPSA